MDVYIYKNTDDKRKLNKTLSVQRSVIADIKGTCSITAPTLILSYQGVDFNYIFVPTWSRYYFVTDIAVTTGGRVEVRCKVDVLMSNNSTIRSLTALIARNENTEFTYLTDEQVMITTDKKLEIIEFTGSVINIDNASSATTNFILAVAGR